jgi:hypothetical protein
MTNINEEKTKVFYRWLGDRFPKFEIASNDAPITCLAKDTEGKEYYIHVEIAAEPSVKDREMTGIKIANTQFYHLYALASQGQNVFWFEAFEDGYFLYYINDCLTPEQLKVAEEFTYIGVTSALHVHKPAVVTPSSNGESFYVLK